MGMIKGQREWNKWKKGLKLSPKQAILAQCFECNGQEDSRGDCQGHQCPLYLFQPYHSTLNL
jgi:hypothetical protein